MDCPDSFLTIRTVSLPTRQFWENVCLVAKTFRICKNFRIAMLPRYNGFSDSAKQKFPKLGIGELVGFPLDRGEVKFILKEVIYFSENSRHARKKHLSQSFSWRLHHTQPFSFYNEIRIKGASFWKLTSLKNWMFMSSGCRQVLSFRVWLQLYARHRDKMWSSLTQLRLSTMHFASLLPFNPAVYQQFCQQDTPSIKL